MTLLTIVLLAHTIVLPLGHWADEYETFTWYRTDSLPALYSRLISWSPRPLSEALIFVYGVLCERTHRPLFTEVLGLCGLAFIAPTLFVLKAASDKWVTLEGYLHRIVVALALPVISILSVDLADTFLWPMSALAYIPGLACIFGVLFFVFYNRMETSASWTTIGVIGVVGSLFVEISAIVFGIFFALLLAWTVLEKPRSANGRPGLIIRALSCLVPIMVAGLIGALILTHRARNGSPLTDDHALVHHLWPSLARAAPVFFTSLIGSPSSYFVYGTPDVVARATARLLYFLGVFCLSSAMPFPRGSAQGPMLALLAVSILVASFISIAITLYQFGVMCCERHDTARTCLDFVALTCVAVLLGPNLRWFSSPSVRAVGVSLMLVCCLVLLPDRIRELADVYSVSSKWRAASKATWKSGWSRSSTEMIFVVPPPSQLTGNPRQETGEHELDHETSPVIRGVMTYFGKKDVVFQHLP